MATGKIGVNYRAVSPDYFKALGVPLRLGRLFTEHDDGSGAAVVIINEGVRTQVLAGAESDWPKIRGAKRDDRNRRSRGPASADTRQTG